jgi:Rrf2 family protein
MIRFSKREDYAILIVGTLAQAYDKRSIPLSEIAKEYDISQLFLRNLANELRDAGVIKAVEGKKGGYYLTQSPTTLKMRQVLQIFSQKQHFTCCSSNEKNNDKRTCPKENYCIAGNVWRDLNQQFLDKIYNMSLQQFLNHEPKKHYKTNT